MSVVQKGEIPFVRVLCPFILGIACSHFPLPPLWLFPWLKILLATLFLPFLVFLLNYGKAAFRLERWMPGLLLHLILFLSGYILAINRADAFRKNRPLEGQGEPLTGLLVSEPEQKGPACQFQVVGNGIPGKLLVRIIDGERSNYKYGDVLLFPRQLQPIRPSLNPGEFDYQYYLFTKSIYYQLSVERSQVRVIRHGRGNSLLALTIALRQQLVDRFNRFVDDKEAASVASTLVLGYRAELGKEILATYSRTGTIHVLSVSGMHVGFVYLLLRILLKSFERNKHLLIVRSLLIVILILLFAAITGFSSPVCRAAVMMSFLIVGKTINRQINPYNLLAVSILILLLINPAFLVDPGFQLSYLAVLGLIAIYPPVYGLLRFESYLGDKLWSTVAVCLSAQLATFPLSLFYFHQFPLYFLISNLFILIPTSVIMYAGLLFVMLPVDFVSKQLGWLLEKAILLTNKSLDDIAALPYAAVEGIYLDHLQYLLLYAILALFLVYFHTKRRTLILAGAIVILIFTSYQQVWQVLLHHQNKVSFLSLNKRFGICLGEGSTAYLVSDIKEDEKAFGYSIRPFLLAGRYKRVIPVRLARNHGGIYYDGRFLQFHGWRMMVADERIQLTPHLRQLHINAVYLRKNVKISIREISENIGPAFLIFDGSNSSRQLHSRIAEADLLKMKYYVLKDQPALVIPVD